MNFSNSTTDKTERLKDTKSLAFQWKTIDWKQVEYDVNRLQTRIAKATVKGDNNKAKRLQYLLTHSFSAKAYAVRKVTTNKGKNTSGVDKKLWSTSASKMKAVLSLTDKNYKAKPLRRVYIEKKDKNQKRPLGIPTMYDRAMQTLHALALEPIAETKGDSISFGFRRGRSAKDACEQIFCVLARKCSPTWILEGDIKGCFDNINHEWLQSNIPMDKRIMKQFLKSGYVYKEKLFPTEIGSPQGGAISSIYANMTLDGLEKVIQDKYYRNSKGKIENHYRSKTKVNLIRYADDFVITANSKEVAEELKTTVSEFLQSIGLTLSEEKTVITHIDKGFDFLGWTFKKYNGKLIVKPSKSSIKNIIRRCSTIILKEGKASTQSDLIRRLNQIIRGWTNYHKHVVASKAFSNINNILYHLLQQWTKHRHPNKNKWWRLNKYWHEKGWKRWLFKTDEYSLINLRRVKIVRHPKLQITKTPFLNKDYFDISIIYYNNYRYKWSLKKMTPIQYRNHLLCA
ncbi:group II intron reverse transcriptase/maturase [Clostridium saccharobutylicum]|uniref:LtrA: group II intron-encoded protein LtrA n=1 Tax=Clostridium saccharobutylicum DSM 13864 TaxID=1345695 RepID=U5MXV3_CLOSA|nr:group II intron reverse transcriptase/maturase [Clostridium saccharobutylicum]AGX45395.1 ltrA: group II intron-encoded protein LtrA [Clostridium saccharobutylicum DSM 13864]AQR92669.1 group II intron-encoded protein LtrA [Clostridium saccharobutylicum]AQS02571.1 group II intron-encoded protein LtrA [Clostridium saccharobutylicum]AQS16554.1 group II intron-encoded protein LtrA [Clostridium saccharobutylicum]MBA2907735.1 RNA-directed DNA polymerase [Clostridium saccharobutylicum]